MNPLQRAIVADIERQTGRHDGEHVFGGEPGDPGLMGPDSISWEINGDVASILLGGIGAIVMEILHPSVMSGVQQQSTYQEDPGRRGRTTFGWVITTTFGNTQAATRLIGAVKKMHGQIEGLRPDGIPYRALDPELIAWVHTCIPWAVMTAFDRFNRPLTDDERDRYLSEQSVVARMSGADAVPETYADLLAFVEEMRPKLAVTQETLEFFEFLMSMPFGMRVPGFLSRPVHQFQIEAGMGLMPKWARRMTGFDAPDVERRLLHDPMLFTHANLVRYAFGTPTYKRLAMERVAGVQERDLVAA